ncbi:MAG: hypothetical protein LBV12_04735 [Puniceicoccales bacterium]|jgi:hypothetical protein|nr:hypothetical protein [Puniceicoccales bacterium]
MIRKDFSFDLDEDAEPVEELHRLRRATTKHFKTMDAYMKYLHDTPSIQEMIAELDAEIAKKEVKSPASRKVKTAQKSTGKRKAARRLTHA